ncbi:hypothetical protein ACUOFC_59085, partial [Escherichia sp. TWPC-MK]
SLAVHFQITCRPYRWRADVTGKEHVEYDNPYDVGMTGLIGFSSGFHTMMNADTLVLLGTQFPYRAFYLAMRADAGWIDINLNNFGIGRV